MGATEGRNRRRAHLRKRKTSERDEEEDDGVNLQATQKKKQTGMANAFNTAPKGDGPSATFQYDSSGTVQQNTDMGATKMLETETELDRDGRSLREKALKVSGERDAAGGSDGTYKGLLGYNDYRSGFRREQNASNMRKTGAFGPLRASSAIRTTFRMDYQPDICKDYKETGFCGYGDSCKFLHDRGDYKSGWQLEKEWEEKEKLRKEKKAVEAMLGEKKQEEEEEQDDGLPFACHICRLPFTSPVVTRCGHYFCEHCALKEHSRTGKCAICKQATNGTFNVASNIAAKMKKLAGAKKAAEEPAGREKGTEGDRLALPPRPPPPHSTDSLAEVDVAEEEGLPPPPPPSLAGQPTCIPVQH